MDIKLLILILNGLTQAAIFFVLGSELTLAFGLMRVINLSHGAFYLVRGYIADTFRDKKLFAGCVSKAWEKTKENRQKRVSLGENLLFF
jgi:branched-subunit amino acid ABC-type transport system permease component